MFFAKIFVEDHLYQHFCLYFLTSAGGDSMHMHLQPHNLTDHGFGLGSPLHKMNCLFKETFPSCWYTTE